MMINTGELVTTLIGVLAGATIGTLIGTEIAYRRTESWIRKLLSDDELISMTVAFLKKTANRFSDEYIKKKIENGELKDLLRKAKKPIEEALFDDD